MPKGIRLSILLIIVFLSSCSCDDTVDCRGFKNTALHAFPSGGIEEIRFSNNQDSIIIFKIETFETLGPYIDDCYQPFSGTCTCPSCNQPYAANQRKSLVPITKRFERQVRSSSIVTRGDSSFRLDTTYLDTIEMNFSNYSIRVTDEDHTTRIDVSFQFLGLYGFIKMNSDDLSLYSPSKGDTILANFSTPFKSYDKVYLTKQQNFKSALASEVYFSLTDGIIGFVDAKTKEVFYRLYP